MFGIFFFLTIFVQDVLGYSALKAGVAFLPFAGMIVVVSGIAGQVVGRAGARPLCWRPASRRRHVLVLPYRACTPPT